MSASFRSSFNSGTAAKHDQVRHRDIRSRELFVVAVAPFGPLEFGRVAIGGDLLAGVAGERVERVREPQMTLP